MRIFLPGWGSTAEVWAPFAAPGDRLDGQIEPGAEVVAWSLGAMRALDAAASMQLASLTLVGASGQFVRRGEYRHGWPERALLLVRERLAEDAGAVLDEFWALALAPGEERADPRRASKTSSLLEQGLAFLADYSMLDRAAQISLPGPAPSRRPRPRLPARRRRAPRRGSSQAELTVWPEAGHAPFLSQPDRFRTWLRP